MKSPAISFQASPLHRGAYLTLLAILLLTLLSPTAKGSEDLTFFNKLYTDGLYDVAIGQMEALLTRNPRHSERNELVWLLGYSCRALERNGEALTWLDEFATVAPADSRACTALFDGAGCGAAAGELQRTGLVLDRLLREFGECEHHAAAVLLSARVKVALGEEAVALQLLGYLIDSTGDDELLGRALFERARLRGEHDPEAARADLEQLKASLPKHPLAGFAAMELAEQSAAQGREESAYDDLDWVLTNFDLAEILTRALRMRADLQIREGRYADAANSLTEFRTRFPGDGDLDLLSEEVDLLLSAALPQEALLRARLYWDRAGDTLIAWHLLGRAVEATGNRERALEAWTRVADLDPEGELGLAALQHLFELHLESSSEEDISGLSTLVNRLLERLPDVDERGRVLLRLGDKWVASGRPLAAERAWESLLDDYSSCAAVPAALFKLAGLREVQGSWREAEQLYNRLVREHGASARGMDARRSLENLRLYYRVDEHAAVGKLLDLFGSDMAEPERSLLVGEVIMNDLKDFPRAWEYFSELTNRNPTEQYLLLTGRAALRQKEKLLLAAGVNESAAIWRDRALQALETCLRSAAGETAAEAQYELTLLRLAELPSGPDRLPLYDGYLRTWGESRWAARLYFERGELYRGPGWSDRTAARRRATEDYQRVLTLEPESGESEIWRLRARLALGHLALEDERHEEASDHFRQIVAAAPTLYEGCEALFGLGEVAEMTRQFRAAQNHFRRYLELAPSSPRRARCLIHIGDACYFLGEWPQAREMYLAVGLAEPDSPLVDDAIYRLALTEEQTGNIAEYHTRLIWLLRNGSPRFMREAAWRLARAASAAGHDEDTLNYLEFLRDLGWDGRYAAEGGLLLGGIYLETGDGPTAVAHFDSLLARVTLGDARPEAELGRVRALLLAGRTDEATTAWEALASAAAVADEERAQVLLGFGRACIAGDEVPRAVEYFEACVNGFPGDDSAAWAHYELAMIEGRARRFTDACAGFDRLLELHPRSAAAREGAIKAAGILYSQGDFAGAGERYEHALTLHDDPPPELLYYSALALEKNMQAEPALARIRTLLARYPDDEHVPEAMMKVGFYLQALGQYERAILAYRNAELFQDREGKARLHFWMADCLESAGNIPEALAEFLRVTYLFSDQGLWGVTATLRAATLYERGGEVSQARQLYEKVIAGQGADSDFGKAANDGLRRLAVPGGQG
ncbi:MAG: tetratricopeptide repeat protein [bacterium]|nr:tetratricopeptide repeat protein [bacterium]